MLYLTAVLEGIKKPPLTLYKRGFYCLLKLILTALFSKQAYS